MIDKSRIVEIGKFFKTHALRGDLNAVLEVDEDYAAEGNPLIVEMDGIPVPFFAESVRPKGASSCLIKLKGIDTVEKATPFVNKIIMAPREKLVEFLDVEDEDLLVGDDYLGYKVIDPEVGELGEVIRVDDATANVLLVVERPDGSELYVPFVSEIVSDIDDEGRRIEVNLPEGLLDLNG